jgi:hypothetical protein
MIPGLVEGYDNHLGKGHPDTLSAVDQISCALLVGGKIDEAGGLVVTVLNEQEKAFGGEHPRTLENLSALGLLYGMLESSDTDKALQLLRRALEGLLKILGEKHQSTIDCAINIIRVLGCHNRHAEGVEIMKEYGLLEKDWEDDGDSNSGSDNGV